MAGNRRCSACGEQNRDLARFCRNCGSPLEVSSGPESADDSRDADTGPVSIGPGPPAYETTAGARRGRSLRFPVAVPVAIVLLAGTLAVVGWQTHWPRAIFGVRQAAAAKQIPTRPVPTPTTAIAGSGGSSSPPAPSSAGSGGPTASATASATSPPVATAAIVVKEYFAAINHGHYAKAWRLGGSNFSPSLDRKSVV